MSRLRDYLGILWVNTFGSIAASDLWRKIWRKHNARGETVMAEIEHPESCKCMYCVASRRDGELVAITAKLAAMTAERDSAVYEQGELYARIAKVEADRDLLKRTLKNLIIASCPDQDPLAAERYYIAQARAEIAKESK